MGPEKTFHGRATLYPTVSTASETFVNPTDVTVIPEKQQRYLKTEVFAGNVAKITVVGGDRRAPTGFFNGYQFWDAQAVTVTFKDGSTRTWKSPNAYSVAIRGGTITNSSYIGGEGSSVKRGLHLLGYDQKRMAMAVTSALAEGLAQGATKTRFDDSAGRGAAAQKEQTAQAQERTAQLQAQAQEKAKGSSNTVWYVAGGAAALAVGVALLVRAR